MPRDRIRSEAGFITRTEKSVLFVIPWGRHWIIGTTDTDWNLDKAHPAASRADIDYLLDHVNTLLREPLDHDDVEGVYAGLRPLLQPARPRAGASTRSPASTPWSTPVPGLVMIAGGKLTTYRVMAQGRRRRGRDSRGRRTRVRAVASPTGCRWSAPTASWPAPTSGSRSPGAPGCDVGRIDHLLGRYGGLVDELLDAARRPARAGRAAARAPRTTWPPRSCTPSPTRAPATSTTSSPGVPASPSRPSTAASHAARPAAELMAGELGWDEARTDDEVDHYLRRVEAERQSQQQLTDQEADEARVSAPDIV